MSEDRFQSSDYSTCWIENDAGELVPVVAPRFDIGQAMHDLNLQSRRERLELIKTTGVRGLSVRWPEDLFMARTYS